jgi:hypothetical protein
MQPIELCKHTTHTSAMLKTAIPGESLIDFGVRWPAAALSQQKDEREEYSI